MTKINSKKSKDKYKFVVRVNSIGRQGGHQKTIKGFLSLNSILYTALGLSFEEVEGMPVSCIPDIKKAVE